MADYLLSCCSTADLTRAHFEARNIRYICFHFSLDGKTYRDDLGESVPFPEFYKAMENGAETRTSQVNISEYVDYFCGLIDHEEKDILHVCLSSGLSGSYISARQAAEQVMELRPGRRVRVVDSLGASSGYGLLMETLADRRDAGASFDELGDWAEQNRLRVHHWFFSTDLKFYIKGGRVSRTAGTIGMLLGICPLLNMDNEGHLIPRAKLRSKKKVMEEIVRRMEENADGGLDYDGKCFMSHSACYDDARAVADMVEKKFPKLNGKVVINDIGTTIGSHTGPGTVALFFFGKPRVD